MDLGSRWGNHSRKEAENMVISRLKGRLSLLLFAFALVMLIFPAMALTQEGGDSYARYMQRVAEIKQSIHLIDQIMDKMPHGPVQAQVPGIIRPRPGRAYAASFRENGELWISLAGEQRLRVATMSYPLKQADRALADLATGQVRGAAVLVP
jgi:Ni,Fe-hydrogenase III large subunit